MNEIFRFMALRAPDTSDPSPVLDISNPKSPFQNLLTTERNRAIGQQTRRGDSSPRNLTVHGVPLRALRTVSLAANAPHASQNTAPAAAAKPTPSPAVRKASRPRKIT
jgi:hypothetical protein